MSAASRAGPDGRRTRLAAAAGLASIGPALVEPGDDAAPWPFGAVIRTGRSQVVFDLSGRVPRAPDRGAWLESLHQALVVLIRAAIRKPFSAAELIARVGAHRWLGRARRAIDEVLHPRLGELEVLLATVP